MAESAPLYNGLVQSWHRPLSGTARNQYHDQYHAAGVSARAQDRQADVHTPDSCYTITATDVTRLANSQVCMAIYSAIGGLYAWHVLTRNHTILPAIHTLIAYVYLQTSSSIHPCTHSPDGPLRPATTSSVFSFHSILFTVRWTAAGSMHPHQSTMSSIHRLGGQIFRVCYLWP